MPAKNPPERWRAATDVPTDYDQANNRYCFVADILPYGPLVRLWLFVAFQSSRPTFGDVVNTQHLNHIAT